jgi:hypothetical protein
MTIRASLSRREFLRLAGLGAGALVVASCSQTQSVEPTPTPLATTALPLPDGGDVMIDLTARPATINLLPGEFTRVWQYQGQVNQGAASSLQTIPDSYLGPILHLTRGQTKSLMPRLCIGMG